MLWADITVNGVRHSCRTDNLSDMAVLVGLFTTTALGGHDRFDLDLPGLTLAGDHDDISRLTLTWEP